MICDLNPKHAEKKASLFYFCTLYHISLGSLGRRIFTMKSPSYFSQNGLKMAAFLQIRCCHATNLHHPFTFPQKRLALPSCLQQVFQVLARSSSTAPVAFTAACTFGNPYRPLPGRRGPKSNRCFSAWQHKQHSLRRKKLSVKFFWIDIFDI